MPVPQRRTCEAWHEIQSKVSNARKQQESSSENNLAAVSLMTGCKCFICPLGFSL